MRSLPNCRFAALLPLGLLAVMAARGEPQVWLDQRVSYEFPKDITFLVHTEERLEPATGQPMREMRIVPQVIWKYSPRYDFGTGYRQSLDWNEDGTSAVDHEGLFFATVKWELGDWRIASRQRFQFGFTEDEDWMGLTRHRVGVEYRGWAVPVRPFADDEWFFDLVEREVNENRVRAGVKYEINKTVTVEMYGMWRDEWAPEEGHQGTPIGGLALNLSF